MTNQVNNQRLFAGSCIALVATAMTFAIRANLIGPLGTQFNIDSGDMGLVVGTAFWGFTLAMIIGGPLVDVVGMRRLLILSFAGHVSGIVLTILATGFWSLFLSTLLIGIANGFVEAACNPLVATIYPDQKTKKLNQFHVWFPGGIVTGGLAAFAIDYAGLGWQIQISTLLIPTTLYGAILLKQKFPVTERVASGISTKEMFRECLRPLFFFMVITMLLTAATELGTNQWIVELLENIGVPAILLLVFINGIMATGRSFAGSIESRLSSAGMLFLSAILSSAGLLLLSYSTGYWSFAGAAVFASGICFFWPTMLGLVSEYLPKTGALGLSIMGGAGMLSVAIINPYLGDFYDMQTALHVPEGYTVPMLNKLMEHSEGAKTIWKQAKLQGGIMTLRYVSLLPGVLIFAFGFLYWYTRKGKELNYSSNSI